MFRLKKDNWLSTRSRSIFEKEHGIKTKDKLKKYWIKYLNIFQSPVSIIIILPIMFLIYLSTIWIDFLPTIFYLSKDDTFQLLNDRLSNLIAIFTISVAISVFIISALQAKRTGEEQFSTIFKESYLYPIIYFILVNIGIISFISFTKNSSFHSLDVIIRMVVLFFWCFIISLFLIGFLFHRIFKFLNTDYLLKKYLNNLQISAKHILEKELITRLSLNIYRTLLTKEAKLKESYWNFFKNKSENNLVKLKINQKNIIKDINTGKILKIIKKMNNSSGEFHNIGLNSTIYSDTKLFSIDSNIATRLNQNINNIFKMKKPSTDTTFSNQKELLKRHLDRVIYDKDIIALKNILETYFKIYELFAIELCKYEKEGTVGLFNSQNIFRDFEFTITDNLSDHIYTAFYNAIGNGNGEAVLKLCSFVYRIFLLSLNNYSSHLFLTYKYYPSYFYNLSYTDKKLNEDVVDSFSNKFQEFIKFTIDLDFKQEKDFNLKKKLNRFFEQTFDSMSQLLYLIIEKKDTKSFNICIKRFSTLHDLHNDEVIKLKSELLKLKVINKENDNIQNQILEQEYNITKEAKNIYNYFIIGVQCWLYYKYQKNFIDNNEFNALCENIKLPHYISSQEKIELLINFLYSSDGYFQWRNWGNERIHVNFEAYSPMLPSQWLVKGYILILIKDGGIYYDNLSELKLDDKHGTAYNSIKSYCDSLITEYSFWVQILKLDIDENTYKKRIEDISKLFKELEIRYERNQEFILSNKKISDNNIIEFKEMVCKAWQESNKLHKLFKQFHNYKTVKNNFLKHYGINDNFIGMKMRFIESNSNKIIGLEEFGHEITRVESDIFIDTLLKNYEIKIEFSNVNDAFDNMIKNRKNKKFNTNLIITGLGVDLYDEKLLKNDEYIPEWKFENKNLKGFQGTFDNIPIISLYPDSLNDKIIFTEFEKAFEMIVDTNDLWWDKILDIEVNLISQKQAIDIAENIIKHSKVGSWALNEKGEKLTKEELINKILTGINIKILEGFQFEIKDKNAFEIVKIKNPDE